jgi:ribosome-binding ATPase YchF (GTP1/OBG family)
MADLGIETPAVEKVIQKSYDLLGLISFLTVGKPEARAWTVRKGTPARKAAGAIHSDMERGFIRAEVTPFDDYITYKTPAALKAAGKTRLEGKDYVVRDGDVILFRFNV